jgi:hypothetical protein
VRLHRLVMVVAVVGHFRLLVFLFQAGEVLAS